MGLYNAARNLYDFITGRDNISDYIDKSIKSVGGLDGYRFNRNIPVNIPAIELVEPTNYNNSTIDSSFTRIGPKEKGFLDLVIVSDGYSPADIHEFQDFTRVVADFFYGSSQYEPFLNFSSIIRIWRVNVAVNDILNKDLRFVDDVRVDGSDKLQFSNLALVSEVGILVKEKFNNHPIIIFASNKANGTSNCQGPYVLLEKGLNNITATEVLIHELGHTNIGRFLSDEYNYGGGVNYRGLEPIAKNVSANPVSAWSKWSNTNFPGFFPLRHEGAYRHRTGIFRFQEKCKMRASTGVGNPFCIICKEELTLGILDLVHNGTGKNGVKGAVYVRIEYLEPLNSFETVHIIGGDIVNLSIIKGVRNRIALSLLGASVPKEWDVKWEGREDYPLSPWVRNGESITLNPVIGTNINLIVEHNQQATRLTRNPLATQTNVKLVFSEQLVLNRNHLNPPYGLQQSIPFDSSMDWKIDKNGNLIYESELWVAGHIGGFAGYNINTFIDFLIEDENGYVTQKVPGGFGIKSEKRRWRITDNLAPGKYTWKARTRWEGEVEYGGENATAPWVEAPHTAFCFEVTRKILFDRVKSPPQNPLNFGVEVKSSTIGVFPDPIGLYAESWHPNDKHIKFQFEVKPFDEDMDGKGLIETRLLKRDKNNFESARIKGSVRLPDEVKNAKGKIFKWRIKCIDDASESEWTDGGFFFTNTLGPDVGIDNSILGGMLLNDVRFESYLNSIKDIKDPRFEAFARLINGYNISDFRNLENPRVWPPQ